MEAVLKKMMPEQTANTVPQGMSQGIDSSGAGKIKRPKKKRKETDNLDTETRKSPIPLSKLQMPPSLPIQFPAWYSSYQASPGGVTDST